MPASTFGCAGSPPLSVVRKPGTPHRKTKIDNSAQGTQACTICRRLSGGASASACGGSSAKRQISFGCQNRNKTVNDSSDPNPPTTSTSVGP